MRQAAKAYFETQVTTTSQGQVLLMLYDGAIKFLNQAKERMAAKDYAGKGILISNAIDIVNELASSLNAEKGGELASNLNQLYFYCNKRLFTANLKMDPSLIDEVIKILAGLRSAYAQIVDTPEAQAAAAQAAASRSPGGQPGRTPLGVQAAPLGTPARSAKVQTAYASQVVPGTPSSATASAEKNSAQTAAPQAAATPAAPIPSAPAAQPVPAPAVPAPTVPVLDLLPDTASSGLPLAPPTSFGGGKRLGASLYQKFAS